MSRDPWPPGAEESLSYIAEHLERIANALDAAQPDTGAADRVQAVRTLMGAWEQRDQEFNVGIADDGASRRELLDVLRALGVTSEEIAQAEGP